MACLMHSAPHAMSVWLTSVAEQKASAQAMHMLDELTAADDTVATGRGCIQVPPRYEVPLIVCGTVGLRATRGSRLGDRSALTQRLDFLSCTSCTRRPSASNNRNRKQRGYSSSVYPCIGRGRTGQREWFDPIRCDMGGRTQRRLGSNTCRVLSFGIGPLRDHVSRTSSRSPSSVLLHFVSPAFFGRARVLRLVFFSRFRRRRDSGGSLSNRPVPSQRRAPHPTRDPTCSFAAFPPDVLPWSVHPFFAALV